MQCSLQRYKLRFVNGMKSIEEGIKLFSHQSNTANLFNWAGDTHTLMWLEIVEKPVCQFLMHRSD